ncbi:hypothetical protein N8569_00725 [bacterium]|nr:hypothetical protein [bacterium]
MTLKILNAIGKAWIAFSELAAIVMLFATIFALMLIGWGWGL